MHNFDPAGKGCLYRRMNDRVKVVLGGLPYHDIDKQMSWDAVAIHGEDSIGFPQGGFESLLHLTTV
ncbi:MAG: hypothetical protein KGJ82_03365 [Nitrospirota bacterium]|nr:hypothetical protein [Nitrospirota bacterium]